MNLKPLNNLGLCLTFLAASSFPHLACQKSKISTRAEKGTIKKPAVDQLAEKLAKPFEFSLKLKASSEDARLEVNGEVNTFSADVDDIIWLEIHFKQESEFESQNKINFKTNISISNPELIEPVLSERQEIYLSESLFTDSSLSNAKIYLYKASTSGINLDSTSKRLGMYGSTSISFAQQLQEYIARELQTLSSKITVSEITGLNVDGFRGFQIDYDLSLYGNRKMPDIGLETGEDFNDDTLFIYKDFPPVLANASLNRDLMISINKQLPFARRSRYSGLCNKEWHYSYDFFSKSLNDLSCDGIDIKSKNKDEQIMALPFKVKAPGRVTIKLTGSGEKNNDNFYDVATAFWSNENSPDIPLVFNRENKDTILLGILSAINEEVGEAFVFERQNNVPLNEYIVSNEIELKGFTVNQNISVAGGSYSINGLEWQTLIGLVAPHDRVRLRVLSASIFETDTQAILTVGNLSGAFEVRTRTASVDPNSFSFTAKFNEDLNTLVFSEIISLTGFESPVPIKIVGGEYSINGSTFTGNSGTMPVGGSLQLRLSSASTFFTPSSATVTVGVKSGNFEVKTREAILTPNNFVFEAKTNVQIGTMVSSNTVVLEGYEAAIPIRISGGEYSINEGAFTDIDALIPLDARLQLRLKSSSSFSSISETQVSVGGKSATFKTTTRAPDLIPNDFTFTAQTDVNPSSEIISNEVVLTGFESELTISISGGFYSLNKGPFTSVAGKALPGASLKVKVSSSPTFGEEVEAAITLGGKREVFKVRTRSADLVPDNFSFISQTNLNRKTSVISNTVTLSGFETSVPISIVGGEYTINGTTFTDIDGNVSSGDSLKIRATSPPVFDATSSAIVTIGTTSASFILSTRVASTEPNYYSFKPETNVEPASAILSEVIALSGYDIPIEITISSGEYSINREPFSSNKRKVPPFATLQIRLTSAPTFEANSTTTLTLGTRSATFSVDTRSANLIPDDFSFNPKTDLELRTTIESESIILSGYEAPSIISVTGGRYSIDGASFTSDDGLLPVGASLRLSRRSSSVYNKKLTIKVTVGGKEGTFDLTTKSGG